MVSEIQELIELREKHCIVRADVAAAIGIIEQTLYISVYSVNLDLVVLL